MRLPGPVHIDRNVRIFLNVIDSGRVEAILRYKPPKIVDFLWNARHRERQLRYQTIDLAAGLFRWRVYAMKSRQVNSISCEGQCSSTGVQTESSCHFTLAFCLLWIRKLRLQVHRRKRTMLMWQMWAEQVKNRLLFKKNAKLTIACQNSHFKQSKLQKRLMHNLEKRFHAKLQLLVLRKRVTQLQNEIITQKEDDKRWQPVPDESWFTCYDSNGVVNTHKNLAVAKSENVKLKKINSHLLSALAAAMNDDSTYFV